MNTLDVWYERIDFEHLVRSIKKPVRRKSAIESLSKLKDKRGHAGAIAKLTEVVDGKRRIKDDPPLIFHVEETTNERMKQIFQLYLDSLWESRQRLIQRYHLLDVAAKVVGVGSVGTAAGIILMQGEGGDRDQIILQIKEATPSVLERFLGKSQFKHPGQRIVNGQRLLQAASDLFLGWTSGPARDFYIRQLMDMKVSVPVDELDAITLEQYAQVCANVLARAHARTGDPAVIHGYLGTSESFDEALVKFALAYAKQNKRDHALLVEAIKKGKIRAGIPQVSAYSNLRSNSESEA